MLEIKLWLGGELTLTDLRAFVELTKDAPGDHEIGRYDANDELDSFGVVVANENPRN